MKTDKDKITNGGNKMKAKENEIVICKKIVYRDFEHTSEKVLLGLVVKETDKIIIFRTARKVYAIPKTRLVSLTDTDEIFQEGGAA